MCGVAPIEARLVSCRRVGGRRPSWWWRSGRTRIYFVAADQVEWDYAPAGKNLVTGTAFGQAERPWVASGPDRIGSRYVKSVYREYTDETFTRLKPRPKRWEHLGLLGPIQAEVGDTILVTLKNNTRFPVSLHAHGVWYDKESEAAPYADGVPRSKSDGDSVASGKTFTYF